MLPVKGFRASEGFSIQGGEAGREAGGVAEGVEAAEGFGDVSMVFRACEAATEGFFIQEDEEAGDVVVFGLLAWRSRICL